MREIPGREMLGHLIEVDSKESTSTKESTKECRVDQKKSDETRQGCVELCNSLHALYLVMQ